MNEQEHTPIHDHQCACGHDHRHHDHDHSDHDHADTHAAHEHDENGRCIIKDQDDPGAVQTEYHLHDEARVVSGRLTVAGAYDTVKKKVSAQLEQIANAVREMGGIVGHIKASCEVRTVEMFSVTDADVSVKTAPEQVIRINLAAIVFLIDPEQTEELVRQALEAVKEKGDL